MNGLNKYELIEIETYRRKGIFYTGELAKKPISSNTSAFQERNGYYRITPGDHLRYRYQILNELGKGTFGSVIKAIDHKKHRYVAIKILRRFRSSIFFEDEEKIMKEISGGLKENHHIVRLLKSFSFRDHTCLVMEFLHQDIKQYLKQKGSCPMDLARDICHDILKALRYLHKKLIIHGDVKPNNIVFENGATNRVKLIDFSCCNFENNDLAICMQTRGYRAPEIVLRLLYSWAIDIWGLAVTVFEVFVGQSLFRAMHEEDMIVQMVEVMGEPTKNLLSIWQECSDKASTYFLATGRLRYSSSTRPQKKVLGYGGEPLSRSIDAMIDKKRNPLFVDFLERCLLWDPDVRITASEGLRHEWIRERRLQKETRSKTEAN